MSNLEIYFEKFRKNILVSTRSLNRPLRKKKLFMPTGLPAEDYINPLDKNFERHRAICGQYAHRNQ
jgi:hypothetical protein